MGTRSLTDLRGPAHQLAVRMRIIIITQKFVQAVASSQEGSWLKMWDLALERGVLVPPAPKLY